MHCVAHFAEETCAERPANGDLETPSQDLEKGKTKTPFYEQTFLWRTEKSSFCFTLFQNSRFCPKKFIFLTYIFIHESNYDFLVRKTTEKYLLGWLTFYRLGWVELYKYQNIFFAQKLKLCDVNIGYLLFLKNLRMTVKIDRMLVTRMLTLYLKLSPCTWNFVSLIFT